MELLKGEALKARAKELGVWKSKMTASELRSAIASQEYNDARYADQGAEWDADETEAILADPDTMSESAKGEAELVPDVWSLVPNRADKRRARRQKRLNPSPTQTQKDIAHVRSILAGEKGKFYGNKRSYGQTVTDRPGALRIETHADNHAS